MLNSNNLVEWLQSEVVFDEKAVTPVGKKIPAAKDAQERYCNSNFHLYASYASYCEDTGRNLSVKSVSSHFSLTVRRISSELTL